VNLCSEITLGICTAREELLVKQLKSLTDVWDTVASVVIILDGFCESEQTKELIGTNNRFVIKRNETQRGLSCSRNSLLSICSTKYLIFLDDDSLPSARAISEASEAFNAGFEIVGSRLVLPHNKAFPWFIFEGQFHYAGIHSPRDSRVSTWGAFMGVNVAFVKKKGVFFEEKLGRKGGGLQSGDDTSFLRELKKKGATEYMLKEVDVVHDVSIKRFTLSYLLCRAWWQGRSEIRRNSFNGGVAKEFLRNYRFVRGPFSFLIGTICFFSVVLGGWYESGRKRCLNSGY